MAMDVVTHSAEDVEIDYDAFGPDVLDVDTYNRRFITIHIVNTGANAIDMRVLASIDDDDTISYQTTFLNNIPAGGFREMRYENRLYKRIRVQCREDVSGDASTVTVVVACGDQI